MLLCREEGLRESLPSPEMFEPGVLDKRPHHHATTCRACVCSPWREGPPDPREAHKWLFTSGCRENKTFPSESGTSVPTEGCCGSPQPQISQRAFPDNGELRPHLKGSHRKAGNRRVGPPSPSHPYTATPAYLPRPRLSDTHQPKQGSRLGGPGCSTGSRDVTGR